MSARHAMRTGQRGFTLIEMIAAFLIFAIAVGALMQILTMSLKDTRRSLDETRAALWAQSLLDNVGIGERIEEGHTNGEFDRIYHWEMDIERVDPQTVEATAATALGDLATTTRVGNGNAAPVQEIAQMELFHVELRVLWGSRGSGRSARFTTLRLAMPDPNAAISLGGSARTSGSGQDGSRTQAKGRDG
ncbi:MAG: type II secretion system protein [Xanthomonadales bacterium]|nr:type II secretion system protein [Xanthomonadales bacterium]